MCGVIAVGGRAHPRMARLPGGGRRRRQGPDSRRPTGRAEPPPSPGRLPRRNSKYGEGTDGPDESGQSEQGMVTAETALSLPAVVLVLLIVLAAVSAGVTQRRVCAAAPPPTGTTPAPGPPTPGGGVPPGAPPRPPPARGGVLWGGERAFSDVPAQEVTPPAPSS